METFKWKANRKLGNLCLVMGRTIISFISYSQSLFLYSNTFSLLVYPIRKGHSAVISHVVLNIVKLQNCPEITNNSLVLADIMAIIMSWLLLVVVGLIVNHFY